MNSNFSFSKEHFPNTCDCLEKAEKSVRQDIDLKILRQALENLVEEIVQMSNAGFLFKKYAQMIKKPEHLLTLEDKLKIFTS